MLAFGRFLDDELVGLRRYAAVLTGDRQAAHDVLADALEKAQRRWQRIAVMDHPAAYVRRMVTSTFVSQQRRWSVRTIRPTRTGNLPEQELADPTGAVDDRAQVRDLLVALPARQRAVVVLRYYLGLDTRQVAAELGITSGAVRTAHSRALAALRIAVGDEGTVTEPVAEHAAGEPQSEPRDEARAPRVDQSIPPRRGGPDRRSPEPAPSRAPERSPRMPSYLSGSESQEER